MYRSLFVVLPLLSIGSIAISDEIRYGRDIRPILSENCFACHGFDAKSREADLRLDTREGAIEEGAAIVPGDSQSSSLVDRIVSADPDQLMPPPETGHTLSPDQIATIRKWIDEGANYENHWAFDVPKITEPQSGSASDSPIDRYILDKLQLANLQPSPRAAPETLLRRVSLDLIGLPPTLDEIESFRKEAAVDFDAAYHSLVERLLSSPHYGERWARWWLDQARYADSNGYSIDSPRSIWKYRDWVIDSLNSDMPFDQFTIEQLAGDLLPNATEGQKTATGFHRNTLINEEGGIDPEQFRIDSVFDRVGTTGTVWLGLTIGCAQCHDHKFDPLTQKEFYQLFAFLNNQDEPSITLYPKDVDAAALMSQRAKIHKQLEEHLTTHASAMDAWEKALDDAAKKLLPKGVVEALKAKSNKRDFKQKTVIALASGALPDSGLVERLKKEEAKIAKQLATGVSTMVLAERSKPRTTTVFIKGDFTRPDEVVAPGTLSVLHPLIATNDPPNRLDLARWIMAPENPLTARVIANRIWQQYFGVGIVQSDNDFGLQGFSPTHPELLDWLAIELQRSGWKLKDFHRTIVHSKTYQQSSNVRKDLSEKDPLNLLLGRQNRLRLEGEIVRDVALVASGLISRKMGGQPVYPPIPPGVMTLGQVNRKWDESQGEDRYRRGLYTFVYRLTPPPSLNVFDAPDGLTSCTRRIRSNTPLQALTLLNDRGFYEFALALQKRIENEGYEKAFQSCTSRPATKEELELLRSLGSLGAARAMLNLDETINRE
jgi:Protein of unknown function (DUF1553)/Protein of unknown function (DUF1549)/Planctomycete cytochrome C